MTELQLLIQDILQDMEELRRILSSDPSDSDYDCSNGGCPICNPQRTPEYSEATYKLITTPIADNATVSRSEER